LSVISLARDLSESGAASETGSVASQSLDVLKDHLERKTNEDPKLVKFYGEIYTALIEIFRRGGKQNSKQKN
jgi:hypothetical protein